MDAAQADLLVGGLLDTVVGGWQIESFLGKGKSSVVLGCTKGHKSGAIKNIHPQLVERYGKAVRLERPAMAGA